MGVRPQLAEVRLTMRNHFIFCGVALCAATALAWRAWAGAFDIHNPPTLYVHAEIPSVPFEGYAQLSTDFVEAVVVGVKPDYSPQGLGCTRYTIQVLSSTRGVISGNRQLYVGGSEDTWPRVRLQGAPTLDEGERFFAFLCAGGSDDVYLQGLGNGLYRVRTQGEEEVVEGLYAPDGVATSTFVELVAASQ